MLDNTIQCMRCGALAGRLCVCPAPLTPLSPATHAIDVLRWRAAALGVHAYQHEPDALVIRFAHALLDEFPDPSDERPARALENYRSYFAAAVPKLREAIREYLDGTHPARTLTGTIWHCGGAFVDFDEPRQRLFLRFGAITLAKVIVRELDPNSARHFPAGGAPRRRKAQDQEAATPPDTAPHVAEPGAEPFPI